MNSKLTQSAWIFLGRLASSWVLVILIIVRYPGDKSSVAMRVWFGGIATIVLLAMAALVAFLGARNRSSRCESDANSGMIAGLVAGSVWVVEISFNNSVDPRVATVFARFVVDNSAWGIIALLILIACSAQALRTQRFPSAMRVGLWSGLTSGLISCLMGPGDRMHAMPIARSTQHPGIHLPRCSRARNRHRSILRLRHNDRSSRTSVDLRGRHGRASGNDWRPIHALAGFRQVAMKPCHSPDVSIESRLGIWRRVGNINRLNRGLSP
jgi:hypothetical protein